MQDPVGKSYSASLSSAAIFQKCSLDRYECIVNVETRKRSLSTEDDSMCEESNGDDLNEQASDDGGSDDGRSDTRVVNQT
jgi:hypothetical protein